MSVENTGDGFSLIVKVAGLAVIIMLISLEAEAPTLSLALRVKVTVAAGTPGVPERTPVFALSDSQEGLLTVDQV